MSVRVELQNVRMGKRNRLARFNSVSYSTASVVGRAHHFGRTVTLLEQDSTDMNTPRDWSQPAHRVSRLSAARALGWAGCVCMLACSSDPNSTGGGLSSAGTGLTPTPPAGTAGTGVASAAGFAALPTAGTTPIGTAGLGAAGRSTTPTAGASGAAMGGSGAPLATAGTSAAAGSGAGAPVTAGVGAAGGGAAGSTGASGSGSSVAEAMGCDATKLLAVPDNPGTLGPWPVGAKTAKLKTAGGDSTVEVWYPAQPGSEVGKAKATYDLSLTIPPSDRSKIPPDENTPQPCDCYRDLPIDTAHGPYPPVIFVHGLASFRTASLTTMTLWASRGFVVVAMDHLGLWLLDFTAGGCGGGGSGALGDMNGDVDDELAALKSKSGDFAFLGDSVDMSRVAIGGHSMGAMQVSAMSTKPNVQVIILLAELLGTPVPMSSSLKYTLVMGGMVDTVTTWAATQGAYSGSPMPKTLVGITGADHLDVTDICSQTNAMGETSIQVGLKHGVCALGVVDGLAHCGNMREPLQGPGIVNYVSTAILEKVMHCQDRAASLMDAAVKAKFSALSEYSHTP